MLHFAQAFRPEQKKTLWRFLDNENIVQFIDAELLNNDLADNGVPIATRTALVHSWSASIEHAVHVKLRRYYREYYSLFYPDEDILERTG